MECKPWSHKGQLKLWIRTLRASEGWTGDALHSPRFTSYGYCKHKGYQIESALSNPIYKLFYPVRALNNHVLGDKLPVQGDSKYYMHLKKMTQSKHPPTRVLLIPPGAY